MSSDLKTIAALGRPFTLGMLYDARRDELIPGVKLWDNKIVQEKITESAQSSSEFKITTSDSIESKSSLLDVEASLKVSYLSGLIEVEGSARYLNDKKKFKNQSRVTCQYKSTTNFKQLAGIDRVTTDDHQINVIKNSSATHVVTGILYGAKAIFVFDSEKLESSSVQEFEGKMKAAINKIPSLSVSASVSIKLTEAEKAVTNKCSCKFIGDFILETNPATYEEAVKTYVQLPQLLGKKGENAVPVKVWLMPLKNLYPEAAKLMSEISVGLGRKLQDALDELREMQIRCNDSLEGGVVENFPILQEEFKTFQKLCEYYESNLQQTMKKKLPSIREGKEDESSADKVFKDRENSPFSQDKLSKWLDVKEREINVVSSCLQLMEGIKIVRNQSELDREVLAANKRTLVCFVFTSMKRGDTFLDEMATYVDSPKLGSTVEAQWFYADDVVTRMRYQAGKVNTAAKDPNDNANYRFCITAITNDKYKGATVYSYYNGGLVNDNVFPKPKT